MNEDGENSMSYSSSGLLKRAGGGKVTPSSAGSTRAEFEDDHGESSAIPAKDVITITRARQQRITQLKSRSVETRRSIKSARGTRL